MNVFNKISGWFRQGRGQEQGGVGRGQTGGKSELQQNMEKALEMKQAAGPQTTTPEHQTAHDGMKRDPTMMEFDRASGREANFTPQLKRSKVARSGDGS